MHVLSQPKSFAAKDNRSARLSLGHDRQDYTKGSVLASKGLPNLCALEFRGQAKLTSIQIGDYKILGWSVTLFGSGLPTRWTRMMIGHRAFLARAYTHIYSSLVLFFILLTPHPVGLTSSSDCSRIALSPYSYCFCDDSLRTDPARLRTATKYLSLTHTCSHHPKLLHHFLNMRLLHSETLEFHSFQNDIPPYAILSHTWGDGEISYQDMCQLQTAEAEQRARSFLSNWLVQIGFFRSFTWTREQEVNERLRHSRGYAKIKKTAEKARLNGYEYFWIDTCNIDKSSSAELQEAINSMYQWYQDSSMCLVYLEDMDYKASEHGDMCEKLKACRWNSRGWTLQELIAPRTILFFDRQWNFIAEKKDLLSELHQATGISRWVLERRELDKISVAQKMSWAANRATTRIEDRAYSLLGILGVHMVMLYGEGENAFLRLQKEILRTTPDDSIFAWEPEESDYSTCRGLLARSPDEFQACRNNFPDEPHYTSTSNLGIRLDIQVEPLQQTEDHGPLYVGQLGCSKSPNGPTCYILLRLLFEDDYGMHCTRVMAKVPDLQSQPDRFEGPKSIKRVYVRQKPPIPSHLASANMDCFHVESTGIMSDKTTIAKVWPPKLFNFTTNRLCIPKTTGHFIGVIQFETEHEISFQLLLGYDARVSRVWCKFVVHSTWPELDAPESVWNATIERIGPFEECGWFTATKLESPSGTRCELDAFMYVGLLHDKLYYEVQVKTALVNEQ
jgi:hypothetical protein